VRFAIAIFLVSITFSHAMPAQACSCSGSELPSSAFTNADAVFQGRVIGTNTVSGMPLFHEVAQFARQLYTIATEQNSITTFLVSKSWKGISTTETVIYIEPGMCGSRFELGVEYLVYGYGAQNNLTTGICTRTSRVEHADEELKYLRSIPQLTLTSVNSPWLTFWIVSIGIVFVSSISTIFLVVRYQLKSQTNL
jgi:hypothetical protein